MIRCFSLLNIVLIIFFNILFLSKSNSEVGGNSKYQKGELLLSDDVANVVEYFFSGGKMGVYAEEQKLAWKPGLMVISKDGSAYGIIRHPLNVQDIDHKNYVSMAQRQCTKRFNKKCFLFATGYRIVWDNGTSKKERRLKKKQIMNGETIPILISLGFYENNMSSVSKTNSTTNENQNRDKNDNNADIVKKIKDLKKLYDDGVLTQEEFEKAKKKILE